MTEINRTVLRELRGEIEEALKDLGEKHGVVFSVGSANFLPTVATFKLEVATKAEDGTVNTKDAENFRSLCYLYQLRPEHLHKLLTFNGTQYKLVGLNPRSGKYPLIVERVSDGKGFKLHSSAADSLRNKTPAE